jgi:putrescine transport system permease protein
LSQWRFSTKWYAALLENQQLLDAAWLSVRITLPLIAPALLSGWLLAFTLSLDDLVIASFVAGPGSTTLPMVVYSSVRMGVSPQINAMASLIVLFVSIAVIVAGLTLRWRGEGE